MSLRERIAAFIDPEPRVVEAIVRVDPDDDLYRSIGAAQRDLHGSILRRAQDLSIQLYRSNPIANRIVKIYTTFMAGAGFTIDTQNPDVGVVADEFWESERSQMTRNHRNFARDFLLYGEGLHPLGVDDAGYTTIGLIDPSAIDHIERNQLNQLILEAVILTRTASEGDAPLKVVRREDDPFDPFAGLYVGDVFAWLYDRIGAAARGNPFLLPVIDWLDAYDQTLWELIERVKATRAFFWDVEVEGGATEVATAQELFGTTAPRSGSVRFHTNAVKVSATQPQIGGYEDVAAARYLLRHISTGAGVAPHWLNDPEDANRSTAERMDVPVFRALEDIQTEWRMNMTDVMRFVVDQKVAVGILDRNMEVYNEAGEPTGETAPAHDLVSVNVPNITDEDVVAAAGALASVATAFVQLDSISVVDRNTISMVVRHILPALGIPADALPEPTDDMTDEEIVDQEIEFLESVYREARGGRLEALIARTEA